MKTKHTKGEWELESTMYSNRTAINSLCNKDRHTVIESYVEDNNEQEANAKLIAAAPELLEALNNLILANTNNKGESVMRRIDEAIEVIKKATL